MTQEAYFKEFEATINNMLATTKAKNQDYAGTTDAFKNFRQIEILSNGAISTEIGIFTRISDKMSRIGSLLTKDAEVTDETIADTLLDLAVYSVIMRIYLQQKKTSNPVVRK